MYVCGYHWRTGAIGRENATGIEGGLDVFAYNNSVGDAIKNEGPWNGIPYDTKSYQRIGHANMLKRNSGSRRAFVLTTSFLIMTTNS